MGPVGIEVWRMSNTTIIMTRASMTISLRGYKTSKWHCTARRRNARERARKEWAGEHLLRLPESGHRPGVSVVGVSWL